MTTQEARKLAEEHWQYTKMILQHTYSESMLYKFEQLYVAAMVHGIKHGQEDKSK